MLQRFLEDLRTGVVICWYVIDFVGVVIDSLMIGQDIGGDANRFVRVRLRSVFLVRFIYICNKICV